MVEGAGSLDGLPSAGSPHHRSGQSLSADSVLTRGDKKHLLRGKPLRF